LDNCLFFFVPGVPHEMRHMLAAHVVPHITNTLGERRSFHVVKTISSFGLTESVTAERLSGFEGEFADIKLGLRAKFPEIQIKLYGSGTDKDDLMGRLAHGGHWVVDRIGEHVFSENGETMEEVIGALLRQQHKTLAIAESCTGGLISDMITNVAGSSDYFLFAGTTYANQAKEEIMGVSPSTLATYGAVHEQTAKEMADGVKRISGASYGLSTSGIAGPDGGTDEKPVGTVCVGLATPRQSVGWRFTFLKYSRLRNKQIFAMKALDLLRRDLLGIGRSQ
jgi:nicotinamide-nucleotide amidase